MLPISRFEVTGLFDTKDVRLEISENTMILVGPNGIGKSTLINLFYFFVSRQWSRLLEYKFSRISITIGDQEIASSREDILGFRELTDFVGSYAANSTARRHIEKLSEAGELEQFVKRDSLPISVRAHYAAILETSTADVTNFWRHVQRRFDSVSESGGINGELRDLDGRISEALSSRILYLPTYRRIEKELREIFPDFEERYRAHTRSDGPYRFGRSADHYIELVSFGMEDVKSRLQQTMQELRDYSLSQHNELSGLYLRDVIHGRADKYESKDINALTDGNINAILDRVSEAALSIEDKSLLRKKVKSIQGKRKADVETNERFLAHYFSRLVSVHEDIGKRERDIKSFVEVCNQYLSPTKRMVYDEVKFAVNIYDDRQTPLELSVLSSGEKQVVAIFSHLYLDNAQDQIVVIDEPELSLSVPWQKRFLPDILESGKCGFIIAVTHSPFIYENGLRIHSKDLRRMTGVFA